MAITHSDIGHLPRHSNIFLFFHKIDMKRPSNFAPHKRQRLKDLWIGRLVCSRKKNKRRRRRIGKNMPKKFVHLSKKNTLKTNLSRRKKAKGFAKEIILDKILEIFTKNTQK